MTNALSKEGQALASLTPDQIHHLSLTTINISHYNEKVRWALDYYQIPYTEYRTLPLLHMLTMFSRRYRQGTPPGGGTPFITPHLDIHLQPEHHPKTLSLINSSTIIDFVSARYSSAQSPHLYAHDDNANHSDPTTRQKIAELEQRADQVIGVHVRRYLYGELLLYAPRSVFAGFASHDSYGRLQKWLWRLSYPLVRQVLIKVFKVTPDGVAKSRAVLEKEFEYFSQLLDESSSLALDSREQPRSLKDTYLVGNRFSAADLALSALSCMVLGIGREDGYGAWVPPPEGLRPEMLEWAERMRATPAGQHVVRCYQQHRGQKAPGSSYGYSLFGWW